MKAMLKRISKKTEDYFLKKGIIVTLNKRDGCYHLVVGYEAATQHFASWLGCTEFGSDSDEIVYGLSFLKDEYSHIKEAVRGFPIRNNQDVINLINFIDRELSK